MGNLQKRMEFLIGVTSSLGNSQLLNLVNKLYTVIHMTQKTRKKFCHLQRLLNSTLKAIEILRWQFELHTSKRDHPIWII